MGNVKTVTIDGEEGVVLEEYDDGYLLVDFQDGKVNYLAHQSEIQ